MRPRKNDSAGRLDGSRAGLFQNFEAARYEHPNLILRRPPFAEAKSDSQLLYPSTKGKGISMGKKLYVGNLAFQTTSQDLQELFGTAGTVESAQVIEDRDTGRSKDSLSSKCRRTTKRLRRSISLTVKKSPAAP
jgi:RNA recognition motif-containing protein